MSDDLLTVAEAALRLRVSTKTVRRYIADGRLQAYRLGPTLLRLSAAEVDELLRPVLGGGPADEPRRMPARHRFVRCLPRHAFVA